MREGIDLVRAGLTLEEGFLVSRIDGQTPVEQIAHLFGKPLGETMRVVSRLARAGVIQWGDDIEATRDLEREQGESDVSDPDLLAEPVDLSEDEKREILRVHAHLDQWSAYELLGCRRRDDPSTIKRAYYAHCKSWHPDRFRSTHLGSYDTRIRDIFRAIQEAHRVLSDPDRRAEYDRTHPPSVDEADIAAALEDHREEDRRTEREAEDRRRRLARNPLRRRMTQAKELYHSALELEAKGVLVEAWRVAQAAVLHHDKEEYRALELRLRKETAETRVSHLMSEGLAAERLTSWSQAIEAFAEAVRIAPDYAPARLRLAYNLLQDGRPPAGIAEHVHQARQALPKNPEAHYVHALWCARSGQQGAANRALRMVLALEPDHREAKRLRRKLRWGF